MPEARRAVVGERRREPRWPCRLDVAIMPASGEAGFVAAEVTDFSEHGLGLFAGQGPRVDEQVIVKLMLDRPLLLVYVVRRREPDGAGYRIGAEYAGAITSPGREDEEAVRRAFVEHLEAAAEGG